MICGAKLIAARNEEESYLDLETVVALLCDEGEKCLADNFTEGARVTAETYT